MNDLERARLRNAPDAVDPEEAECKERLNEILELLKKDEPVPEDLLKGIEDE